MTVVLDHMSIATTDKVATAEWYARLFGVTYNGPYRMYAPVRVNDGLQLNFEDAEDPATIERRHYAYKVSAEEFEAIRQRLVELNTPYGSGDTNLNGEVYERNGLRGYYFNDPNGHGCEVITPSTP
jgi:hypothetical protein